MGAQQLDEFRNQIGKVQQDADELTRGLNEAQFNWRPAPDHWSIEECLAHLTIVGQWELHAIEEAIDDGRARGLTGSGSFQFGLIERFIVDASGVRPDGRAKRPFPAPRRFIPLHGQPITAVVPTFQHLQRQLLIQMDRAEGLDLARIKVRTPISRFLKLSLGAMFAQIVAHEQRHIAQARRVREQLPSTTAAA